jgi:hypothetical protein
MADQSRYPEGAYLSVRSLHDGWRAVMAVRGSVIAHRTFPTRQEAFAFLLDAEQTTGLPSLVERVA